MSRAAGFGDEGAESYARRDRGDQSAQVLSHSRLRGALESEIDAFAGAVHGDPRRPVPSCPGWDVQELVWHLGEVQASWARNLRAGGAAPTSPIARPEGVTIDWYRDQASDLLTALDASQPDDPCWNWTGADFTAAWVLRRQAQEAAVHRWDAEAVAGDPMAIDVDLATDGVDELLEVFLRAGFADDWIKGEAAHLGKAWRLQVTDADVEQWTVRVDHGVAEVRRGADGDADAVTSAPASDLLLARWGRLPFEAVDTTGDASVLRWWRALPIFD